MSRGIYFTFDGIFAAFLIVGAAFLLLTYTQHEQDTVPLQVMAGDIVAALNTMTIKELPDATLRQDVYDTGLANENDTVLYAIGVLWAEGNNDLAGNITEDALESVSPHHAFAVFAEGVQIYNRSEMLQQDASRIASSKQQVSGIAPGKPLSGSTATAYLRRVENKTTSSFAYFGGLVGQGNITVFLPLPADVNSTRITSLTLELDTPQNFTLYVNGTDCGYKEIDDFNMTPTVWDLMGCVDDVGPGNNSFTFIYENISNAYIAGGYIKAVYTTDLFTTAANRSITTYRFPQVEGVVNVYDAFVIPQTLRNLTVELHYETNEPGVVTYLTIGEKTVYESNRTGEVYVTLTDVNFTNVSLDYAFLSNKTVPVRFSSFNTTTVTFTSGNADVVIITDYSGSMKKDIDSDLQGQSGNLADCESIYAEEDIRRTHLARCLNKEVVEILMEYPGNRIWPVYFFDNQLYNYTNPTDEVALIGHYTNGMPPQGKERTCIACALSEAYDIFTKYNDTNRSRFVILMSDGLPTHCTGAGCDDRSRVYGAQHCEGFCDESGSCSTPPDICTNSACSQPMDNSYAVAQMLNDTFNATIFTVGFGPVAGCDNATQTLQRIAELTGGEFNWSDDIDELRDIYENISHSILERLLLDSQILLNVPQNATLSKLYNDSFIIAQHDKPPLPPQNMIELTRQTPQFGSCTPTVNFPSQIVLQEAYVMSYSGVHWTDYVLVNSTTAFNLTDFLVPYYRLGDPYRVHLPVSLLSATQTLRIHAGDNVTDTANRCSNNNSLVYTALVPSATPRTAVLENAEGCTWTIERDDGTVQVNSIPGTYTGANTCSYNSTSINYDSEDALQSAVYQLLRDLDFDGDGRIFVSLSEENLEVIVTEISSVPYLWGPSLIEVRAWQ